MEGRQRHVTIEIVGFLKEISEGEGKLVVNEFVDKTNLIEVISAPGGGGVFSDYIPLHYYDLSNLNFLCLFCYNIKLLSIVIIIVEIIKHCYSL